MLVTTNAIVLSKIKYRDNDIILKCYTESDGLTSYIIRHAFKSKKSKFKPAYLLPLTQLKLHAKHKKNSSLHNLTDVKLFVAYETLHTDVLKSAVVFFISEVLTQALKEEESNEHLYNYLSTSLQWFDQTDWTPNFHLLFLVNLTKYLGFYPQTKEVDYSFFNLEEGKLENQKTSIYSVSGNNLTLLKQLLGIKFDTLDTIKISSKQRHDFLNMILLYFELHLGGFKKPKSLSVLNQIFS